MIKHTRAIAGLVLGLALSAHSQQPTPEKVYAALTQPQQAELGRRRQIAQQRRNELAAAEQVALGQTLEGEKACAALGALQVASARYDEANAAGAAYVNYLLAKHGLDPDKFEPDEAGKALVPRKGAP